MALLPRYHPINDLPIVNRTAVTTPPKTTSRRLPAGHERLARQRCAGLHAKNTGSAARLTPMDDDIELSLKSDAPDDYSVLWTTEKFGKWRIGRIRHAE